jgi:CRISPR-associated protein Cas2
MPVPQLWIVAYDTPSSKRRRKLASLLEGYGQRVQWSVFECRLQKQELQALVARLNRVVLADHDRVRLWPVPESSCARVIQLGQPAPPHDTWDVLV